MERPKLSKGFSWWNPKDWKPKPPGAADEQHTAANGRELPQGDQKWRLNNPKKRDPVQPR